MSSVEIESISSQLEQRIESKSLTLPMLPQVTNQVLSLVNDEDSDALALAKLIQSDQALAGHVMRIANSAAYSPNSNMTSLQQAIARLGMKTIGDISLAATMGPSMFPSAGYESIIKDIWQGSLATAIWAREIARQCRRNVESTFLCGLLFQIGRPVVLQTVLEISKADQKEVNNDDMNELMSRYHARVGSALADYWQLPVAVQHTINGVDSEAPAQGSQDIVDMVKAANVFSVCTVGDRNYDFDALSTNGQVVNINLYTDDVQQLLDKSDMVHETMSALTL